MRLGRCKMQEGYAIIPGDMGGGGEGEQVGGGG